MITITGATGHIGNVLVRELLNRGEKIRALIPDFEDTYPLKNLDIKIVKGDVRDLDSLINAFNGAEYVYHLAGIVSIGSGMAKKINEINVLGTKNVIEACIISKVKRLVYVSSIHAFTEPPHGIPILETKEFDPCKVVGFYGKSKAEATIEVLKAIDRGLDAVILHPTGVIGPYEFKLSNTGQVISDFLNKRLFAYIDGAYDFVDVRDVALGIIQACEYGRTGENYILSGEQITVFNILKILEEETGIKAPKTKIPIWLAKLSAPLFELYYRLMKQQPIFTSYSITTLTGNSLTSCDKATKELGYKARPIRESIKDTITWLMENEKKK